MSTNTSQTLEVLNYTTTYSHTSWIGKIQEGIISCLTYFEWILDFRPNLTENLVSLPSKNQLIWMRYPKILEKFVRSDYNRFIAITGKIEVDKSGITSKICCDENSIPRNKWDT